MEDKNILYKEKIVYKALEELDNRITSLVSKGKLNCKHFTLNVIGGFAMTVEQIRMSDFTDIDYIGKDLPTEIKDIIDEIGLEFRLGRGWINNDVLMSGNSLEDLEFITGKLEFNHAFDLNYITVNTLDKECILRMKLIAIDTSFSAVELGGDFSRIKDFPDVELLMNACNFSYNEMVDETFDYVYCPDIYFLIKYYLRTHDLSHFNEKDFRDKIIKTKGKVVF